MKVHPMMDLSHGEAYDQTQCDDAVRSGDVLLLDGGVAIMCGAWPVMVGGDSTAMHKLDEQTTWQTFEGGKYENAAHVAGLIYQGMKAGGWIK